ncbi:hypothetical protein MKW98_023878, partial [Papaver atlanticum]
MSIKFTSAIIIIGSPKKNLVMDFTDVSNSLEAFVKAKQLQIYHQCVFLGRHIELS